MELFCKFTNWAAEKSKKEFSTTMKTTLSKEEKQHSGKSPLLRICGMFNTDKVLGQ